MPGKTAARWAQWKGCKGSGTPGGTPGGGGSSLTALKSNDPLCSVSPSFKARWVRGSRLHCVVAERSCMTVLWGTGLPAGQVGWNSTIRVLQTSATKPICSACLPWASWLQVLPVCSSLGIPGWTRMLLQRSDAVHRLFNSGHCRRPLGYPEN